APNSYDQKVKAKFWKEETPTIILEIKELLASIEEFTKENIESQLPSLIKERGWKMGAVMNSLRLLLVGESKGPGVADIISLIGKEQTIERLSKQI
ncbi:MAG: glutamate--tRNA ligase, partial [Bacteroidales bacterium]|nr:glutamate--tRNA ligase [Bacteroidales bacterium]